MNTTLRIKVYTAISCAMGAAALCTALTTSVLAEDVPSKIVRFHDLDLSTSEGAQVLYSRIRAAARDVCAMSTGGDPILGPAIKACIDKTVDKAVKGVNAPMLTRLRFGTPDVRLASK
jgi:UrcA family protein